MTFAELLREARPRRITQQQAADHIGVSDSALSTWERGQRIPDVSDFVRLMKLYGSSYDDVIRLLAAAEGVTRG